MELGEDLTYLKKTIVINTETGTSISTTTGSRPHPRSTAALPSEPFFDWILITLKEFGPIAGSSANTPRRSCPCLVDLSNPFPT